MKEKTIYSSFLASLNAINLVSSILKLPLVKIEEKMKSDSKDIISLIQTLNRIKGNYEKLVKMTVDDIYIDKYLNIQKKKHEKYEKEIFGLIERIVDLMIPFRTGWYELPEFNGSYSIKSVLPVMIPELGYDALTIQEGGMASLVYSQLKNQTPEVQLHERKNLLEYCKMDTLAVLRLIDDLKKLCA